MGKKILIDVTERGRNGGKARAKAMKPADRSAAARKAVTVRWDKVRAARAAAALQAEKRKRRRAGVAGHVS